MVPSGTDHPTITTHDLLFLGRTALKLIFTSSSGLLVEL
jgi:hypothetical protein